MKTSRKNALAAGIPVFLSRRTMETFAVEIHDTLCNAFEDTDEGPDVRIGLPDMYVTVLPRKMSEEELTAHLGDACDKRRRSLVIDLSCGTNATTRDARTPHVQSATMEVLTTLQGMVLDLMADVETLTPSIDMYYVALDIMPSRELPTCRLDCTLRVYKIKLS
jgi:hypothetical protein